jgi:hypothetical protein
MAKPKQKALTYHNGQYRASIGYWLGDDGEGPRRCKVFMLGSDLRVARIKESWYRRAWGACARQCKAGSPTYVAKYGRGEAIWEPTYLVFAERMIESTLSGYANAVVQAADYAALGDDRPTTQSIPKSQSSSQTPATGNNDHGQPTLRDVTRLYVQKIDNDVRTGERSDSNAAQHRVAMDRLLRFITPTAYDPSQDKHVPKNPVQQKEYFSELFARPSLLADQPMDRIGYEEIAAFATNMKDRRISRYAPDTIDTTLGNVDDFLEWAEDSRKWRANCNYGKLLKCRKSKLFTPEEKAVKRQGVPTATVEELQLLYSSANPRQRLFMSLGLNLCCTQQQIADLMTADLKLSEQVPLASFVRGKTEDSNNGLGVQAEFELWPEAVDALKIAIASRPRPANPHHFSRLLLSEDGHLLVRYDGGKSGKDKVDSIRMSWERLLRKVKAGGEGSRVRWLPFSVLRDTISTLVRNMTTEEVQQMALAHAPRTMAGQHYTGKRDFRRLHDVMWAIHDKVFADVWRADQQKVA